MEDRLEEAIHVLRNHAVGQGPGLEGAHSDMHSLLSSVHNGVLGGLSPAFPNASLALSNRHPAMVSHLLCSNPVSFVCVRKRLLMVYDNIMKQTKVFICGLNFITHITPASTSEASLWGVCFHAVIVEMCWRRYILSPSATANETISMRVKISL